MFSATCSVRFFDWQHQILRNRFRVRACDFARFINKAYVFWWRWAFFILVFAIVVLSPVKKEEPDTIKIFLNPLMFIEMRADKDGINSFGEIVELNSRGAVISSRPLKCGAQSVLYKALCFCGCIK